MIQALKQNKQSPDMVALLAILDDDIMAEMTTMSQEVDNAEMWRRQGRVQALSKLADYIRQPSVVLDK